MSERRSRFAAAMVLLLSASFPSPAAPAATDAELIDALARGDTCAPFGELMLISKRLKDKAFDLATGTMLAHGLCTPPDWERAASRFERAFHAGVVEAAVNLSALFAKDRRDVAAALWWARQNAAGRPNLPKACVDDAPDVERFVLALRQWPSSQLLACLEVARVWSEMVLLTRVLRARSSSLLTQAFVLSYQPERGTITWVQVQPESSIVSTREEDRREFLVPPALVFLRSIGSQFLLRQDVRPQPQLVANLQWSFEMAHPLVDDVNTRTNQEPIDPVVLERLLNPWSVRMRREIEVIR